MAAATTATKAKGNGDHGHEVEVAVLPVSDVDRAQHFYKTLGWRLDADILATLESLVDRG